MWSHICCSTSADVGPHDRIVRADPVRHIARPPHGSEAVVGRACLPEGTAVAAEIAGLGAALAFHQRLAQVLRNVRQPELEVRLHDQADAGVFRPQPQRPADIGVVGIVILPVLIPGMALDLVGDLPAARAVFVLKARLRLLRIAQHAVLEHDAVGVSRKGQGVGVHRVGVDRHVLALERIGDELGVDFVHGPARGRILTALPGNHADIVGAGTLAVHGGRVIDLVGEGVEDIVEGILVVERPAVLARLPVGDPALVRDGLSDALAVDLHGGFGLRKLAREAGREEGDAAKHRRAVLHGLVAHHGRFPARVLVQRPHIALRDAAIGSARGFRAHAPRARRRGEGGDVARAHNGSRADFQIEGWQSGRIRAVADGNHYSGEVPLRRHSGHFSSRGVEHGPSRQIRDLKGQRVTVGVRRGRHEAVAVARTRRCRGRAGDGRGGVGDRRCGRRTALGDRRGRWRGPASTAGCQCQHRRRQSKLLRNSSGHRNPLHTSTG